MMYIYISFFVQIRRIIDFNVPFLAVVHKLLQGLLVFMLDLLFKPAAKQLKILVVGPLLSYPLTCPYEHHYSWVRNK